MKRALVATASVLALFGAACTIVTGLHLPPGEAAIDGPQNQDGSAIRNPDGGPVIGPDGAILCTLKHPPGKPAAAAGGTDTTFVAAMEKMVASNTGKPFGFDLDGLCTCPGKEACKTEKEHCDVADGTGLDNSGAGIFQTLLVAGVNVIDQSNVRISSGTYGVVYKVEGYNGLDNDDAVAVTVYRSRGISSGPTFTQVESWPVGPNPVHSTSAWVAQKTLVAHFDSIEVPFLDDTIQPAHLTSAVLSAPIVAGPSIADAVLAGRANTNEMIASVGQVVAPETAQHPEGPICFSPLFVSIGSQVCGGQDLPIDPGQDGKDGKCEALALAISFSLVPAQVGGSVSIPAVDERCDGTTPVVCP